MQRDGLGPSTNTGAFYLATNSTLASYPIGRYGCDLDIRRHSQSRHYPDLRE
jgi:hypothetical protein